LLYPQSAEHSRGSGGAGVLLERIDKTREIFSDRASPGCGGGVEWAYDTRDFVEQMRELQITPHVAQNTTHRRSAIDGRTTRHEGYAISQKKRKRVEEVFGWMKTIALQRKTRFRGPDRVGWMFTFAAAAYNLIRMRNLMAQTA
jgi:hypothetical protein